LFYHVFLYLCVACLFIGFLKCACWQNGQINSDAFDRFFYTFFSRLLNVHRYPFALSPSPWLCPQTAPRLTSKIPAPPMMVTPGDKYTSGAINLRFLTEIAVYLGNGAKLASVCNGSLEEVGRSIRRSMLVPMTLSDLERRDARGHIFCGRSS